MVFVSYIDALAYCGWVGATLPTEAQFEYLLRANSPQRTRYPWGDSVSPPKRFGNYFGNEFKEAYDFSGDTRGTVVNSDFTYRDNHPWLAPVGSYLADANGLFDISGNASEWCRNPFTPALDREPYQKSAGGRLIYPRVLRGGGCFSPPGALRCAWRRESSHDSTRQDYGFRCVRPTRIDAR